MWDTLSLQIGLQAYGESWPPSGGTKCHYGEAIALAVWELCRRRAPVIPTFGEIAAVVTSSTFQPPKAKSWTLRYIVENFAEGTGGHTSSYCAIMDKHCLAVSPGILLPGERVGIWEVGDDLHEKGASGARH